MFSQLAYGFKHLYVVIGVVRASFDLARAIPAVDDGARGRSERRFLMHPLLSSCHKFLKQQKDVVLSASLSIANICLGVFLTLHHGS